ncbi:hypothetical protein KAR91_70745 [Candidatus Pacearchaeota archaeon]|nr:hypothetical protein [Candidatus Pacearchaeota archaeon]
MKNKKNIPIETGDHLQILTLRKVSELLHKLLDNNSFSTIEAISYHETISLRNEIDIMLIKNVLSKREISSHSDAVNKILYPD